MARQRVADVATDPTLNISFLNPRALSGVR